MNIRQRGVVPSVFFPPSYELIEESPSFYIVKLASSQRAYLALSKQDYEPVHEDSCADLRWAEQRRIAEGMPD